MTQRYTSLTPKLGEEGPLGMRLVYNFVVFFLVRTIRKRDVFEIRHATASGVGCDGGGHEVGWLNRGAKVDACGRTRGDLYIGQ